MKKLFSLLAVIGLSLATTVLCCADGGHKYRVPIPTRTWQWTQTPKPAPTPTPTPAPAITLTSASTTLTPPPQAVAAGFKNLVFDDEFTSASTIAPNESATSGYNWYWYGNGSTSNYAVNTGAGSGATAGATGILTINNSPDSYNAVLQTVPGSSIGTQKAGTWQHAYFEARIQFSPKVTGNGGPAAGWPSFWLWAAQANSPVKGQETGECDIMEAWPNGTSGASSEVINTMHNWENSSTAAAVTDTSNTGNTNLQMSLVGSTEHAQPTDGAWHTYGCLWTGNGKTGTVEFYYDNFLIAHQNGVTAFPIGVGAGLSAMEGDNMYIILGSARGWPINVDWVHVWQ